MPNHIKIQEAIKRKLLGYSTNSSSFENSRTMCKLLILVFVLIILSLASSEESHEQKCPGKWFESDGCCYLVGKKKMTFLESRKFCKNRRKFNGTQTQLAPLTEDYDYELLDQKSIKRNLRKLNNTCGELPCKWWIRNVEEEGDKSEFVGPCVQLVQIKQWKFKVHKYVDCFERKRPLCARHLKEMDD